MLMQGAGVCYAWLPVVAEGGGVCFAMDSVQLRFLFIISSCRMGLKERVDGLFGLGWAWVDGASGAAGLLVFFVSRMRGVCCSDGGFALGVWRGVERGALLWTRELRNG